VPRLCDALHAQGWDVSLASVSRGGYARTFDYAHEAFASDFADVPILRRLQFSSGLRQSLARSCAQPRVLHGHGLWLMPNLYPAWVSSATGAPLIISPRGMLGEAALRFSRHRKRLMSILAQDAALMQASCFHATSWQEFEDIRRAGLSQPVAVIPNGIDLPEPYELDRPLRPKALYIGRLHPKKGLDMLIRAWAQVEASCPSWDLEIVGPSEIGYRPQLEALVASLGVKNIHFRDATFGDEKHRMYASASLFVMPTLHENFGMTVAEALASGVPVICSKGAPWQGLETHGCGWWTDGDIAAFALQLRGAMSLDEASLQQMGRRGRARMQN
jgi:glycosyltransferase involved in cell wall biosynthesis